MSFDVNVHDCLFQNIQRSGDGGALCIETDSLNILIYVCKFDFITITNSGGAIYISSLSNEIRNSLFYHCYTKGYSNDKIMGNALYIKSGDTIFNNNEINGCGFDSQAGGDSSFFNRIKMFYNKL